MAGSAGAGGFIPRVASRVAAKIVESRGDERPRKAAATGRSIAAPYRGRPKIAGGRATAGPGGGTKKPLRLTGLQEKRRKM